MQAYARVSNGRVMEIIRIAEGEPPLSERYHASIVSEFIPLHGVDASLVRPGYLYDGAGFSQPAAPASQYMPRYVPVATIRERMEAQGRWSDMAAILQGDMALMLKVLTLREGIAADDPQAREMIAATGADPDEILAP